MPKPDEKDPAAAPEERLTPAGWAERKSIAAKADPAKPWIEPVSSDFRYHPADVLHGWSHHAYNYQAPADELLLTEADFDAALTAAAAYPATPAHAAAVAPHAPFKKQLEAEQKKADDAKAAELAVSKDKR